MNQKKILSIMLLLILFCFFSLNAQTITKRNRIPKNSESTTSSTTLKSLKPSNTSPSSVSTSVGSTNPTTISVDTKTIGRTNSPSNSLTSSSNNIPGNLQKTDNGTVRWWNGNLGQINSKLDKVASIQSNSPVVTQVLDFLDKNKSALELKNPTEELQLMTAQTDELGYQHIRFQQVYKGLKVWGKDLYVHIDNKGQVYSVNGIYESTPFGVSTTPAISSENGINSTINDLKGKNNWELLSPGIAKQLNYDGPTTELVVYPGQDKRTYLAYAVNIRPNLMENWIYFIDAKTGNYIDRLPLHRTLK